MAPAFERQARAYAAAVNLPPARVLVLPIGTASPDAAESVPLIKEAASASLKDLEKALGEPVSKIGA
ncbi:MAG: hypothetical protein HY322_11420 [Betaproteobacteria bacterium]|nr:hypothetical protein [Betaproteobacteria bacterium]